MLGILGDDEVATSAVIEPAKAHSAVIVVGIACSNEAQAEVLSLQHDLDVAYSHHQELINDGSIDAVYISVKTPLRFEWAMRALASGKHVLIDMPAAGCVADVERLFDSPMLQNEGAPVLLEAAPFRFHPSWAEFERHLDRVLIAHVKVTVTLPAPLAEMRFQRELAGGAGLGLAFALSVLRSVYNVDALCCNRCEIEPDDAPVPWCGQRQYTGVFQFPHGGIGEVHGEVRPGLPARVLIEVQQRREDVGAPAAGAPAAGGGGGGGGSEDDAPAPAPVPAPPPRQRLSRTRRVTLRYRASTAPASHKITIEDREREWDGRTQRTVARRTTVQRRKAYRTASPASAHTAAHWTPPGFQLDAFLNRIRGVGPPHAPWAPPAHSIGVMRMLDAACARAGTPPPFPPSLFTLAQLPAGNPFWESSSPSGPSGGDDASLLTGAWAIVTDVEDEVLSAGMSLSEDSDVSGSDRDIRAGWVLVFRPQPEPQPQPQPQPQPAESEDSEYDGNGVAVPGGILSFVGVPGQGAEGAHARSEHAEIEHAEVEQAQGEQAHGAEHAPTGGAAPPWEASGQGGEASEASEGSGHYSTPIQGQGQGEEQAREQGQDLAQEQGQSQAQAQGQDEAQEQGQDQQLSLEDMIVDQASALV